MSTRIVFNGKEYPSAEAMPPEVRKAWEQVVGVFADRDGDGVPDLFHGGGEPAVIEQSSIVVNGTSYPGVEAMPPDVRRMYEQAMAAMGDGQVTLTASAGSASRPPAPILAAAQRRSHGDMSPRWGEERPRSLALPWVLVIVLLAVLAWVVLR